MMTSVKTDAAAIPDLLQIDRDVSRLAQRILPEPFCLMPY